MKQKKQQKAGQSVRVKQDSIEILQAHRIEPMTFSCLFSKDTLEGKSLLHPFGHWRKILHTR